MYFDGKLAVLTFTLVICGLVVGAWKDVLQTPLCKQVGTEHKIQLLGLLKQTCGGRVDWQKYVLWTCGGILYEI